MTENNFVGFFQFTVYTEIEPRDKIENVTQSKMLNQHYRLVNHSIYYCTHQIIIYKTSLFRPVLIAVIP